MKVKDLIAELQECDPEAVVVLQRDPEGNGYAPCAGADSSCVFSDDDDGQVYGIYEKYDNEEDQEMYGPPEDAVPCVVIWPTR